ncbi:glucose-6-phosphate isomerase [Desulfobotulus sp. H1]|uniref:Glucose-6-phosphate isomerase n=1 Tax=Desulfobotulus pelophilus TaxID=2823377 RepID=A0ABT3NCC2_9BACT|nr:glucose-6-phosphate isomerase [Desulfobotulus pelophilus]MCW7755123.1 glucose-6-phosphate isomerase [Desulfobotulus pelophilus]
MPIFHDKKLKNLSLKMKEPAFHLRSLLQDKERCAALFYEGGGLYLDLCRQNMNSEVMVTLTEKARERGVRQSFQDMMAGLKVNASEKRAVLHTAARNPGAPVWVDGNDAAAMLATVLRKIFAFADAAHNGEILGSAGNRFSHVLVVGIGGSRLGTEAVYEALKARHPVWLPLVFLSTIDPNAFYLQTRELNPKTTLVLVVSKSFTTREVAMNQKMVRNWLKNSGVEPSDHMIHVTAKGSPGDCKQDICRDVFHMFEFIGGRYSASSAVGTLPLSLAFGKDVVERFLAGCREMDAHAAQAPEEKNLPLLAALCDIWNGEYLGFPAFVMVPYAAPLLFFSFHMQQLYMESLGKGQTLSGQPIPPEKQAMLCFGHIGTDAQHSFFQMLHQGRGAPVEFIGVLNSPLEACADVSGHGLTPHEELWSNLLAQADAFALGRREGRPEQLCPGNRPSSILTLRDLDANHIGRLLAYLEARTVYVGLLKDINPFDQFGVENGKTLAADLRKHFSGEVPSSGERVETYLNALRQGFFRDQEPKR